MICIILINITKVNHVCDVTWCVGRDLQEGMWKAGWYACPLGDVLDVGVCGGFGGVRAASQVFRPGTSASEAGNGRSAGFVMTCVLSVLCRVRWICGAGLFFILEQS